MLDPVFAFPILNVKDLTEDGLTAWDELGMPKGGVILRGAGGIPGHDRILTFARKLGRVGPSVLGVSDRTSSTVHDVRPLASGVVDEHGVLVRSTTFQDIPLHTDGYNAPTPPRIVVLQAAVPGTGGATLVARVADIVGALRDTSVALLATPVFPVAKGLTPILWVEDDRWRMRFNFYEIRAHQIAQRNNHSVTLAHVEALSELNEVLDYESSLRKNRIHLKSGDVLVIDNAATLNGRLELHHEDTETLQHRVWCY